MIRLIFRMYVIIINVRNQKRCNLQLLVVLSLLLLPSFALSKLPPITAKPMSFVPPAAPWSKRIVHIGKLTHQRGLGLIDLTKWPPEPYSPSHVDEQRLAPAIYQLCGKHLENMQPIKYAHWIAKYSKHFEVDPFMLAALMYYQSGCRIKKKKGRGPMGLTGISWESHQPFVREGRYRYWVLQGQYWVPKELDVSAFPFTRKGLLKPEHQLYFAAALMRIYREQCPDIDSRFASVPHRHYISHLVWGDRVVDAGSEDKILLARRRILQYYADRLPPALGRYKTLKLKSPLDGPPREITSGMGDVRAGGRRPHLGLDFASTAGEPVRAIADGWVFYAGVDLPARGARKLLPYRAYQVSAKRMGAGGLFVMIQHKEKLVSAYMHLKYYTVQTGQWVKAGTIIGAVGRTGIKIDVAHLHFEFRVNDKHINPIPYIRPFVIPPQDSYRGRYIIATRPYAWRRARFRLRKLKRIQRRAKRTAARSKEQNLAKDSESIEPSKGPANSKEKHNSDETIEQSTPPPLTPEKQERGTGNDD